MNTIHHSPFLYNCFQKLFLCKFLSQTTMNHIMCIIVSVFMNGYSGKTVNFSQNCTYHRTTIAHFLNHGKWDDNHLQSSLKESIIQIIWAEAMKTGKPIYFIVDDTIASKTKPSSNAKCPIEDAYFHQSHLKKKQDYGHQAVAVLLSCNGITLNYDIVLYDKSQSKIDLVHQIAEELPNAPVISYFLCDCWYTSNELIETFILKGFYTIGALKTNRILYPKGIRMKLKEYASLLSKQDFSLVTVRNRRYFVARYEGNLNGIGNGIVLLCYPENAFGKESALRAFLCTNVALSTYDILKHYVARWKIEVFFRQSKSILAFDQYQIRSSNGIRRYWLLMSLAHYICCMSTGSYRTFEEGYQSIRKIIQSEKLYFIYQYGKSNGSFEELLQMVG